MSNTQPKILIVEDNSDNSDLIHLINTLTDKQFDISFVNTLEIAIKRITEENVDAILLLSRPIRHSIERKKITNKLKATEDTYEQLCEKIKESEIKYRTIVENSQDGIFIILDSIIQFINETFAKMIDYKIEEIIGKNFEKFVAPEDLTIVVDRYHRRQMGEDVPNAYEFRLLHKDGKTRTVVDMKVSTITYNGKIVSIGTVKDITEQKRYEEKLKESEERYRTIVQNSNNLIWSIDRDGHFTFANIGIEKIIGYKSEELIGQKIDKLIPKEDLPDIIGIYNSILLGNIIDHENSFICKDNKRKTISTNSFPLYSRGRIVGATSFGRDVTEHKIIEETLKTSTKKLERSNKELEQFAYIASHDLQEPLRSVYSFTQLLAEKLKNELDIETKEYIEFILDGTSRMRDMIGDLLILSKINTRGKPFGYINLSEILTQVSLNLHNLIIKNKARVTIGDMPTIFGDRSQLIQLFQNLIGNAIKFRKIDDNIRPQVDISAFFNQTENKWIFSVKDNGIGIDPKNFNKLFVTFQRLHNREEYPGTGIGLVTCKRIVERHEGEIWVDSKLGVGSNFQFSIPNKETFEN